MKRWIVLLVLLGLACGNASAATIHARVVTDQMTYYAGDTVHWTLYAWTTPADGTSGVALLAMNLADDTGDALQKADQELVGGLFPQLAGTAFGLLAGFDKQTYGTLDPATGALVDVIAADTDPSTFTPDIGINDGTDPASLPVFAQGEYVAASPGQHTLSVSFNGANYWAGPSATAANPFEDSAMEQTHFSVSLTAPTPGDANGDGCIDGIDLAQWQRHYDPLGLNANNTFAMGDWNRDGLIDGGDLSLWQQNYDPIGAAGVGAATAVPEPATLLLLAGGVLAALRRRVRTGERG